MKQNFWLNAIQENENLFLLKFFVLACSLDNIIVIIILNDLKD